MRLWPLYEVLLLLCLCVVSCVAGSGQTAAMRRAHQVRKVNQIAPVKPVSLGQILVEVNPQPSKPPQCKIVAHKIVARTPTTSTPRTKFCRPKTVTGSTNGTTHASSKSSSHAPPLDRVKWLCTLASLAAVLLLYTV